jgi:hypothetical protein
MKWYLVIGHEEFYEQEFLVAQAESAWHAQENFRKQVHERQQADDRDGAVYIDWVFASDGYIDSPLIPEVDQVNVRRVDDL